MTLDPRGLLNTLTLAGLTLTPRGDLLDIEGDLDTLTDDLIEVIRDHKAELLALLRAEPQPDADRSPLGSLARPVVCRGTRMPRSCVWDTCDGDLVDARRDLYQCAKCGTWFQLLAPETGFVFVAKAAI